MQTVLQKAVAGNKKAMIQLYNSTKQRVYYVAKLLLQDDAMAESATIWVYRFGWGEIKTLELETVAEFEKLMLQRVVGYCKKRTIKHNSKAFHVPENRNFNIKIVDSIKMDKKSLEEMVLNQFSDLQRYIYVLHTIAKYEDSEIESVVNLKGQILQLAINAESRNMDVILQAVGMASLADYKDITLKIIDTVNSIQVPQRVDDEVNKVIEQIVKPIIEKERKKRNWILTIVVNICIIFIGLGLLLAEKNSNIDEYETEKANNTQVEENIESEVEIVTE